MVAVSKLPVSIRDKIQRVAFPSNYEAARAALASCVHLDEVKDWHDKSVAIAAYAKQAKDQTLLHQARRIRLRAIARMGELLMEYQPGAERMNAGAAAGLPENRTREAVGVAKCPTPVREEMIEQTPPPGPEQLVLAGLRHAGIVPRVPRYLGPSAVMQLDSTLNELLCGTAAEQLDGLDPKDAPRLRDKVRQATERLDEIQQILEKLAGD